MISIREVTYEMKMVEREFIALWKLLGELGGIDYEKADLSEAQVEIIKTIYTSMGDTLKTIKK